MSPPSRSSSPCVSGLVALIIGPEVFAPLRAVGKNFHAAAEGIDAADACLTLHEEEMGSYLACSVNSVAVSGLSVKSREGCTPGNVTFFARPGAITALVGPNKRRQVDGIPRPPRIASRCLRLRHSHRTPPRPYLLPVRPLLTAGTVADNLRLGGTQQPVKPTSSPPTPPSAPPSPTLLNHRVELTTLNRLRPATTDITTVATKRTTALALLGIGMLAYMQIDELTWLDMMILLPLAAFESHHALPAAFSHPTQRILAMTRKSASETAPVTPPGILTSDSANAPSSRRHPATARPPS
ncbi:MAG: hypothetical protein SPK00_01610 [Corynebacterium glucuronolyticum]|nr:hypothetical protein [Corynebacterium glucuronolyticum]MDD7586789.1 hypothetical protein [Mycobacteriaceae bacterium]MDY5833436.1 hypothetical protein [Corynebacterium glucuronolyticum]